MNWVRGAKQNHNLTLDYVGVLNEAPFTTDYIVSLRAALDSAGFHTTKLVASDQGNWDIFDAISKNATVRGAVDVLGVHHMHPFPHPADATGRYKTPSGALALPPTAREPDHNRRPLWSSEDGLPGIDNAQPNWGGAITYVSFLFSNLRLKGETATILCPAFNGWRTNVGETLHGFLWAREPHSGHWAVGAGLWVGAHWTHHTERGWWYLGGGSFAPAPSVQEDSDPVPRVCKTKLMHADSFCRNDHTGSIGTYQDLTEKQCAQKCAAQSQCGLFEWGCTGNRDCILLAGCSSVYKSSCGNSVYGLINSSRCPITPAPPPPDRIEQWDLNGSWVVLAPSNESSTFTVLAETVNAQSPQSVRITVHHANMDTATPMHLNVFLTCLAPSCLGFPSKLHSREATVPVSASGEVSIVLQPAAVYTLTTLSSPELRRPIAPPQRSFFSEEERVVDGSDALLSTVLFRSAFGQQQPQEPGFGLANYYGNFEVSTQGTLRQTSLQPPWAWNPKRPDGMPQSIFGANAMNYAVSTNVRMAAGSARVCGRVGEFHGGFESMNTWETPPGICLTLSTNGTWSIDGYAKGTTVEAVRLAAGHATTLIADALWTYMRIEFVDYTVSATIGDSTVASAVPLEIPNGMLLGTATGIAAIGTSWDAIEFNNITLVATRVVPDNSLLHELLLLNYTAMTTRKPLQAGFILLPHTDLTVSALGRFQPPTRRVFSHLLRIVQATNGEEVCSCNTSAASLPDLLGFINCDVEGTLRAGHQYYIVSEEAPDLDSYFSVAKPGWSVSSGYSSWVDYDRNMSTIEGGVALHGGEWSRNLEADTMNVALNIHAVALID